MNLFENASQSPKTEMAMNYALSECQNYYNAPLLVEDRTAEFLEKLAGTPWHKPAMAEDLQAYFPAIISQNTEKPYEIKDGIAIIRIRGMLEHSSQWYSKWWTGYDAIRKRFDLALEDPQVKAIAQLIGSGGGMVSGNFDLNDHIYKARGKKPIWTIVDEHAYSAAYSLASAAEKIIVTRTGGVGSIGVVAVLFNYARYLEGAGIATKVIRSADRKMKPNAIEPFEEKDLNRLQKEIMATHEIFVETVARNRGVDAQVIRDTQAATLMATEGVELGLADAVMSVDDAFAALQKELNGSTTTTGVNFMTTDTQNPGAAAQPGPQAAQTSTPQNSSPQNSSPQNNAETGYTQAHLDQAIAQAKTEAKAEGAQEENQRMASILTAEESTGREKAAIKLALKSNMDADTAKDILADMPKAGEHASTGEDPLSRAMRETGGGAGLISEEENLNTEEQDEWALFDSVHGNKKA